MHTFPTAQPARKGSPWLLPPDLRVQESPPLLWTKQVGWPSVGPRGLRPLQLLVWAGARALLGTPGPGRALARSLPAGASPPALALGESCRRQSPYGTWKGRPVGSSPGRAHTQGRGRWCRACRAALAGPGWCPVRATHRSAPPPLVYVNFSRKGKHLFYFNVLLNGRGPWPVIKALKEQFGSQPMRGKSKESPGSRTQPCREAYRTSSHRGHSGILGRGSLDPLILFTLIVGVKLKTDFTWGLLVICWTETTGRLTVCQALDRTGGAAAVTRAGPVLAPWSFISAGRQPQTS